MSMITKAGVKANKLLIGITSYGRGFRMSDSSCSGPMCTYTGSANSSDAYKGRCTNTAGYISNAEIREIIDGKYGDYSLVDSTYDSGADSNILIYGTKDQADWVAYMDSTTKNSRSDWVKRLNFGGTTDWAVDLMEFVDDNDDGDDGDGKCSPDDATYSDESITEGSYMPWYLMDPENAAVSAKQYITIVNLTPHRFILEHTHSYQMTIFDWDDIPSGRARQNTAEYNAGDTPVDDNGEAYYDIEGTDKKFVIRATTHIPDYYPRRTVIDLTGMGMGQREYSDPGSEVPVTLVITGSDDFGFTSSLVHGPGNWMHNMYDVIKDRPLKHIVVPGTHDSGMSTISHHILTAADSATTQTQGINMYNQLRAGARWFDLRVMSVHQTTPNEGDYGFWASHVNDETAEVAIGNTGEGLTDIIDEINQFTEENPGEIIILRMKYLIGIRKVPSLGPIYWTDDIADDFFTQMEKINNRCGGLDAKTPFQNQPASYFMDRNDGAGCVLIILDGRIPDDVKHESNPDGFYTSRNMGFNDHWSEMDVPEDMAEDQTSTWKGITRSNSDDNYLISQWLVTVDFMTSGSYGLQNIAILPTNPSLYWMGVNEMSPEKWPNVLMVDYIGVVVKDQLDWDSLSADLYTLAIGLNLFMISENCEISPDRSPLLPSASTKVMSKMNLLKTPWNGIIFANGTKLDNPPPTLHPGRVEILRNGTVFSNGTVLATNMTNPDFNSTTI